MVVRFHWALDIAFNDEKASSAGLVTNSSKFDILCLLVYQSEIVPLRFSLCSILLVNCHFMIGFKVELGLNPITKDIILAAS